MERDQATRLMQGLLKKMVAKKGSDLFITAGFQPAIKVDGEIHPAGEREHQIFKLDVASPRHC